MLFFCRVPHFSPILGEVGTTVLAAAKIKSPASQAGLGKLPVGTLPFKRNHLRMLFSAERQPYTRSVLCPTSIIYPSGSRM